MRRAVARLISVLRATSLSVIAGASCEKAWITARPRSRPCSVWPPAVISSLSQPGVAGGVLAGVVRVEVDEAALDEEVADLEHVAPPPSAPLRHSGPPRPVLVLAVRRPLGHDRVAAGEDPVEVGVVVADRLQLRPDLPEHLPDLLAAVGDPPLRERHLGVGGEQLEDVVAGRRDAAVVERLQVLQRDRLALLVGHHLGGYRHAASSSSRTGSLCAAFAAR